MTDKVAQIHTAPKEREMAALTSEAAKAREYADTLRTELAGLPILVDEAIVYGRTKELAKLKAREAALPAEIAGADILAARCRVALLEGKLRKVRSEEGAAQERLYALNEEMREMRERLNVAQVEASANGGARQMASQDLRDARDHLGALIDRARTGAPKPVNRVPAGLTFVPGGG